MPYARSFQSTITTAGVHCQKNTITFFSLLKPIFIVMTFKPLVWFEVSTQTPEGLKLKPNYHTPDTVKSDSIRFGQKRFMKQNLSFWGFYMF